MKKYFKIRGRFEELYSDYVEDRGKVDELYGAVRSLFAWESDTYIALRDGLAIEPTERDKRVFGTQLRKSVMKNGCMWFKANSEVGKYWTKQVEKVQFIQKPVISWYLGGSDLCGGSSKQNLFKIDGVLYGSLEKDFDFEIEDEDFEEIKASEFYKVVETYEERGDK